MGLKPMNESSSVKTYLRAGVPTPVTPISAQGEQDAAISLRINHARGVKLPYRARALQR